jgi:hypothetical protein
MHMVTSASTLLARRPQDCDAFVRAAAQNIDYVVDLLLSPKELLRDDRQDRPFSKTRSEVENSALAAISDTQIMLTMRRDSRP